MGDESKYEYQTVRAVRGTDGLVISRMQKDGWEFVEQAQGTLRTTLTFRRPKKPVPWLLIGTGAAVLAILAAAGGIASALSGDEKKDQPAGTAVAASKPPSTATGASKPPAGDEGQPAASEEAAEKPPTTPTTDKVITSKNNKKFAALLKADSCDDANVDFAAEHQGETIAFNGSIVNMMPHGDYKTRYDLLLGPGSKGPQTTEGPAFKFEDVNVSDLNLTGDNIPATVGEGDTFRFVAEVREFNPVQCSFYLDPISTEVR
ncbi:hypothetical protein AMIS_30620 [Actinoplanes missouriensis 431]|uniref:DUF4839 domain-containing protein n=1 Tax=Actinoplanes missouriensis (strain ATCC 14538 / DSM 43046 / CBS 188.64 / JCM 3121 / NBRC 102363 / NCIMB 12654 / NRRL B-3342 / UNCC 431) TaxID=512565 RepID=I0H5J5_ACTM4|nr:DUF4839 domain-containing protein [Actinoplanes missouriensis]BAL88282.1 hypothetical protein AMIS_30620 [Actinoplanes missouriensis 431]